MNLSDYSKELELIKNEILEQVRLSLNLKTEFFYQKSAATANELSIMWQDESAQPLKKFFYEGTAQTLINSLNEQFAPLEFSLIEHQKPYIFSIEINLSSLKNADFNTPEILAFIQSTKNARSVLEALKLKNIDTIRIFINLSGRLNLYFSKTELINYKIKTIAAAKNTAAMIMMFRISYDKTSL